MADGGIHDQLGGGFHRYATDAQWLVPHFEQMLYDNAQLAARLPARLGGRSAATRGPRRRAVEVLDYLLRELTTDDGAFAASQDADTEGIEGLTFTWRAAEIREVLGDAAPGLHRGLRRHRRRQLGGRHDPVAGHGRAGGRRSARRPSSALAASRAAAGAARRRGRSRRATTRRWPPGTGWRSRPSPRPGDCSGRSATRPRPSAAAETIVRRAARRATVSLRRSWKDGRAVGQGVLEDYAHLAEGLLALYETTFDERWFAIARGLADRDPRAVRAIRPAASSTRPTTTSG